jgi:hypothetical protein
MSGVVNSAKIVRRALDDLRSRHGLDHGLQPLHRDDRVAGDA